MLTGGLGLASGGLALGGLAPGTGPEVGLDNGGGSADDLVSTPSQHTVTAPLSQHHCHSTAPHSVGTTLTAGSNSAGLVRCRLPDDDRCRSDSVVDPEARPAPAGSLTLVGCLVPTMHAWLGCPWASWPDDRERCLVSFAPEPPDDDHLLAGTCESWHQRQRGRTRGFAARTATATAGADGGFGSGFRRGGAPEDAL